MNTIAIGLMTGTSADGIDGTALEIGEQSISIRATETLPFKEHTKEAIREVSAQRIQNKEHAAQLDMDLGNLHLEIASKLMARLGPEPTSVIGMHGQTVHHSPNTDPPFSIQLGNGPRVAEATGVPVVTDFRAADLAAGGQGAPLAPAFHQAAFSHPGENRAIVNIGGIANITLLPADSRGSVIGFDSGPGNALMDGWVRKHYSKPFDRNGNIARKGRIQHELLDILLQDSYFDRRPPKSTGLERFNHGWLKSKLHSFGRDCDNSDILATLTEFTARTICNDLNHLKPEVTTVVLCGGGSQNRLLVELIAGKITARVTDSGSEGIDPQWVEASAFAWMADRTVRGLASTLPSVTGAKHPCIAGIVHYPGNRTRYNPNTS